MISSHMSGKEEKGSMTRKRNGGAEETEQQPKAERIEELINPTAIASSPTQEDFYWGRMATGSEEDYYWRRLSDNWYMKDVIPSTYLELHNTCYEAYNRYYVTPDKL